MSQVVRRVLTFAITAEEPTYTLVTEMCYLGLTCDPHALIPGLYKIVEPIFLLASMINSKVFFTLDSVLK